MGAAFAVGGRPQARKVLEALGFQPYNNMSFLSRPLRPLQAAVTDLSVTWKVPLRAARNVGWRYFPPLGLPAGWDVCDVEPSDIPASLWPKGSEGHAVSRRSPELLYHIMECPVTRRSACFLLRKGTTAVAYGLLIQAGNEVRLADYGPADLGEDTSCVLGHGIQLVARSAFPQAVMIAACTSERGALAGFMRSGLRLRQEKPICVLKLNSDLDTVSHFRLTLMDWDKLFDV
jgi:hypothetical protein